MFTKETIIMFMNGDLFTCAYEFMKEHEGGFVNNKNDKGGATKWGISLRFLDLNKIDINQDGIIDINDIKDLTPEQTKTIYYNYFWRMPKIYMIPYKELAIKAFDMGVNAGPGRSIQLLQRAINLNLSRNNWIITDGKIGPQTCGKMVSIPLKTMIDSYCETLKNYYLKIIKFNPSQEEFKNGWLNRAYDVEFVK